MMPIAVIAVGVVLALILPKWIYPLLTRLGIVDVPNERSSHSEPTIRGMGTALAIAASLTALALAVVNPDSQQMVIALTLLGASAAALGFVEDWRGIRVARRAGIQLMIGCAFGALVVGATGTVWIWVLVSAISVAAYINVANFMDGIDGISGLHGGVSGVSFAVLGIVTDRMWMTHMGLIAAGVFLSFLPWNLSHRRVFLGDVGSYFLGAWISGLAILAMISGLSPILAIGPMVIYLADTGFTLLGRIHRGERWFEAHRTHVYQQLAVMGTKHIHVALLVAVFSGMTACISFLSLYPSWLGSISAVVSMLLVAAGYLSLPTIVSNRRRGLVGN